MPKGFEGRSEAGAYGDAVEYLDVSVGILMNTLKRLGIEDNTIVIFSSDNGPLVHRDKELENCYGRFGFTDPERTHILREGKYQERFDGGIRVACIMSWPGTIPTETSCDESITGMDLFTTLANISGAKIPQDRVIDGKNILPLMQGDDKAISPHTAVYGFKSKGGLMSVRYKNWKLIMPGKHRTGDFETPQLYNLTNDIGETTNVADNHPSIVKEILQLADNADKAVKENRPIE